MILLALVLGSLPVACLIGIAMLAIVPTEADGGGFSLLDVVGGSIVGILLCGGFWLYMLPSAIALFRSHTNLLWLAVANVALGWSGVGWIALLVWSILDEAEPARA